MKVIDVIKNDKVWVVTSEDMFLAKDCIFSEEELSADVIESYQDWSDSITPNTRTYVWEVPGKPYEFRFAHSL